LVAAGAFGPDAQIAGGASVQALAAPAHVAARPGETRRLSVLAAPDAPARLFLDRLDRAGLQRPPVVTLWHAMALAWGAAPNEQRRDEDLAAVVLIESDGRLAWCWARGADLVACGRARVADAASAAARLNADWLGWSAQLGLGPERIACVAPPPPGDEHAGSGPPDPYEPLARALDHAWPGAAVRYAAVADPVGATLRQALTDDELPAAEADASRVVRTLSARPGRAHKSMYRWLAAAIAAGAVLLAAAGWRLRETARDARAEADEIRAEQRETLEAFDPRLTDRGAQPIRELRAELERLTEARAIPSGVEPLWPVMPELEAIVLVLSSLGEDVELTNLSVNQTQVLFEVIVPDTETYETVQNMLRAIDGARIEAWSGRPQTHRRNGERVLRASFTGTWPSGPANRPPATPAASGGRT